MEKAVFNADTVLKVITKFPSGVDVNKFDLHDTTKIKVYFKPPYDEQELVGTVSEIAINHDATLKNDYGLEFTIHLMDSDEIKIYEILEIIDEERLVVSYSFGPITVDPNRYKIREVIFSEKPEKLYEWIPFIRRGDKQPSIYCECCGAENAVRCETRCCPSCGAHMKTPF